MAFIIIETKREISSFRYVILDILSKSYEITGVKDFKYKLIIEHEAKRLSETDLFLNLAEELYADLKVYVSDEVVRFDIDTVMTWFDQIPFKQTSIYNDSTLLLKRTEHDIDDQFKKQVLKKYYQNEELLHTIKVYLESNQNMSKAAEKLYLHRNTLIQRLDKFHSKTGFDVRKFVDAYIIYSILK